MAACGACGTTILFGGVEHQGQRYCNADCAGNGVLLQAARQVPEAEALLLASKIHGGACPKCSGYGPIDIHKAYQVWSLVLMTSWKTLPQISCRKCAVKSQVLHLIGSGVVGWWGFPWGLIMTPVQIVRNIVAMISPPDAARPSRPLMDHARIVIVQHTEPRS
jgi:hypothetical protein